jgi:hypothetical protein
VGTDATTGSATATLSGRPVVIASLGMPGESRGLALRQLPSPPRVFGWARRAENVREALAAGIIAAGGTDTAAILPQADLTVTCVPVRTTTESARQHASLWRRLGARTTVLIPARRDRAGLEQARDRRQQWFDQWQKLKGNSPV